MRSLAIAFALLGLLLAVLAVNEWGESSEEPDTAEPPRRPIVSGLILFLVCALSVAVLWLGATDLGWAHERTLWVGTGTFLAVMTLARPWWFWEDYRARRLRDLIGDEPTAGLYLVIATVLIWVGLFTEWAFGG